jgi:hypothetical protein
VGHLLVDANGLAFGDAHGPIATAGCAEFNQTMDVLAHALWTGVGTTLVSRRSPLTRRTVAATITLGTLPDIVQLLPIAAWVVFGQGTPAALTAFAFATPGSEPMLPAAVALMTHHLQCATHSAVVAGAVTLLTWIVTH